MKERERIIGNIPAVINEPGRFELKLKPSLVKRFMLDVSGILTVGFGGGNAVEDNPHRFIREIRFETSDGTQYKAHGAIMQNFIQQYEKGTAPYVVGTLAGALIANPYAFRFTVEIDFNRVIAQFPEITILNTNNFDNLTMIVQFGNAADFVDANGTLGALACQVVQVDRMPADATDETEPRLINQLTRKITAVTGPGTDLAMDIPDKAQIQQMYIIARNFTAGHIAGERVDNLINNVRVVLDNGNRVERRVTWPQIQQRNKEDYGVETNIVGFGVIDYDPDGSFDDLLDLRAVNAPQLLFDVNAPGGLGAEIEVGFRQIVTPAVAA